MQQFGSVSVPEEQFNFSCTDCAGVFYVENIVVRSRLDEFIVPGTFDVLIDASQFEAHFYSQGGGSGSGTAGAVADVGLHLVYHFNREFVGVPSPTPEPSTLGLLGLGQ
jgi:hypothetical protein